MTIRSTVAGDGEQGPVATPLRERPATVIHVADAFGCDTMATIVMRTLETRRERILGTLLLALAIPCSAQLGVMLGMLGGQPLILALWALVVTGVFLLVGFIAAKDEEIAADVYVRLELTAAA